MKISNSATAPQMDRQGKKDFILRQFTKGLITEEQATEELDLIENAEYFEKNSTHRGFFSPFKQIVSKLTAKFKASLKSTQ